MCLCVCFSVCVCLGCCASVSRCGQDEASDDDIARVLTQLLLARPEAEPTLSLDRIEHQQ